MCTCLWPFSNDYMFQFRANKLVGKQSCSICLPIMWIERSIQRAGNAAALVPVIGGALQVPL